MKTKENSKNVENIRKKRDQAFARANEKPGNVERFKIFHTKWGKISLFLYFSRKLDIDFHLFVCFRTQDDKERFFRPTCKMSLSVSLKEE